MFSQLTRCSVGRLGTTYTSRAHIMAYTRNSVSFLRGRYRRGGAITCITSNTCDVNKVSGVSDLLCLGTHCKLFLCVSSSRTLSTIKTFNQKVIHPELRTLRSSYIVITSLTGSFNTDNKLIVLNGRQRDGLVRHCNKPAG